jgi:hypothetical protein
MSNAHAVGLFSTYRMNTSKQVDAVNISTHHEKVCPIDLLNMSILRIQTSMRFNSLQAKTKAAGT